MRDWLSITEATAHFVTPKETLRTWAKRGKIVSKKIGGVRLYNTESIRVYEKYVRDAFPKHLSSRRRRAEDMWKGL